MFLVLSCSHAVGQSCNQLYKEGIIAKFKADQQLSQARQEAACDCYLSKDSLGGWLLAMNELAVLAMSEKKMLLAKTLLDSGLVVGQANLAPDDHALALTYNFLGEWQQKNLNYPASLKAFHKSIKLIKNRSPVKTLTLARLYGETGRLYGELGNTGQQIHYNEMGLELRLASRSDNPRAVGQLYNSYGVGYMRTGDYQRAIVLFEKAIQSFRQDSNLQMAFEMDVRMNMGTCFSQSQDYTSALLAYQTAWDYYQPLVSIYPKKLSALMHNLGSTYLSMRQYRQADSFLNAALQLKKSLAPPNKPGYSSMLSLRKLGELYSLLGKKNEADSCLKKSQSQIETLFGSRNPKTGTCYLRRGQHHLNFEEWKLADVAFEKAIQIYTLRKQSDSPNTFISPNHYFHPDLLEALQLQIYARLKSGSAPLPVLRDYLQIVNLMEHIRNQYSQASRVRLKKKSQGILRQGMKMALEEHEKSGESDFLEIAIQLAAYEAGMQFRESVFSSNIPQFRGVPTDTIKREQELKSVVLKTIANLGKWSFRDEDSAGRNQSMQKYFEASQSLKAFRERLAKNAPHYYALRYRPQLPQLDSLRRSLQSLAPETLLLFFIKLKADWGLFACHADSSFFLRIPRTAQMMTDLRDFQSWTSTKPTGKPDRGSSAGHRLYQHLIAPARAAFPDHAIKRLLILPSQDLAELSFAALPLFPIGTKPPTDSRRMDFLIQHCQIQYLDALETMDAGPPPSNQAVNLLAIGQSKGLSQSWPELQVASHAFPKNSTIDTSSRANALLQRMPDYRYLHFASHAGADPQNPSQSYLQLSHDSLLMSDLFALDLRGNSLVVLGACQSGKGLAQTALGRYSLAAAFRYAGSESVVLSFWNANDAASLAIMTDFYTGIAQGQSRVQALCEAQRQFLKTHRDDALLSEPYYWAQYAYLGPLTREEDRTAGSLWLVLSLGLLAWYLYRKGLIC